MLIHHPYDLSNHEFDWLSTEGLQKITDIVAPSLPFVPALWQLQCSARLLNGQDVFCLSATGDGKSALMYIPALVRLGTITVVISPTNYLEGDMVLNMKKKGLSAIAINSETLAAAELERPRRNLWAEAATGKHQMLFFGPEAMRSSQFNALIVDPSTRQRLALFCVDEAHLGDEWGVDFRTAYGLTTTMRARMPEWTTYLALTASSESGRQTESIIQLLGFRRGGFHFEKRDCERHNVDIILREVKYNCSGYEFRDLDWLIPADMTKPSDLAKTILYSETIELGHRIVIYLRKLLPPRLQPHSSTLIRHIHSLNCPECKVEGLASLYKAGDDRECALFVSTAVLEVGFDLPDLEVVVMYATPSTASGLIQRAGRPARSKGMHGKAIIYIKKKDIQETITWLESGETFDSRLLVLEESLTGSISGVAGQSRHLERDSEVELVSSEDVFIKVGECGKSDAVDAVDAVVDVSPHEDVLDIEAPPALPAIEGTKANSGVKGKKVKKKTEKIVASIIAPPGRRKCMAIRLVIAAHIQKVCITRQLNIIYDNPGKSHNCGRCSSCVVHSIPEPRPLPSVVSSNIDKPIDTTPGYMKLTGTDIEYITNELEKAAQNMWTTNRHPDSLLLSTRCFVSPAMIKKVTQDFHLIVSEATLKTRLATWRYWEYAGSSLWNKVQELQTQMKTRLEERHLTILEKQRAQRVHKTLVAVGLGNVKRVVLRLPIPPQDTPSLLPVQDHTLANPIDPVHFYSSSETKTKRLRPASQTDGQTVTKKIKRTLIASTSLVDMEKENLVPVNTQPTPRRKQKQK